MAPTGGLGGTAPVGPRLPEARPAGSGLAGALGAGLSLGGSAPQRAVTAAVVAAVVAAVPGSAVGSIRQGEAPRPREAPVVSQPPTPAVEPAHLAHRGIAYFHNDLNGAPLRLTTADGDLLWSMRPGAAQAPCGPVANPLRFQGQYADDETGLHYNRHRYYDPGLDRYVTQDPLGITPAIDLYSYGRNPISWMDPLGLAGGKSGGAARVREGQRGEAASSAHTGMGKNTASIPSASGKRGSRIPDHMTPDGRYIAETKNVAKQHLSSQILDDKAHVLRDGVPGRVDVIVDTRTALSRPLLREHLDPGSPVHVVVIELNKACPP